MAKSKKLELFIEISTDKDFDHVLNQNKDKLICAEVYSGFCGSCLALDRLFTMIKFEWGKGQFVLLKTAKEEMPRKRLLKKVLADEIQVLERFRGHSEPTYLFIVNKKVTKVFRGVDSMRFADAAKLELQLYRQELASGFITRPVYDLNEATPGEIVLLSSRAAEVQEELASLETRRAERHAARKRHRAELMVPHLQDLAFVLFWPHAHHAHPELYERWDQNNIIMVGREEIQLDEDKALDVLYAGDAPVNEASLHKLLDGPSLAICFRLLDEGIHFVSLVRKILYEEIPPLDDTKPMRDQPPQKTAFDYYKTFSPSREQIWQQRREETQKRREEVILARARRLSEMQRLARQAIEDALEAKKKAKEELKMELLKSGNLSALEDLKQKPDDEEVDIEIPEELPDEFEEESSEEEDENEYFPPAGLLIPGFYAPPNDIAKANGLAVLFPGLVYEHVIPQPEFLPPHVLVMLHMYKRHKAIEVMAKHKNAVIHMGIFKGTSPYDAVHVAYTVKQFETMDQSSHNLDELRLAFMVSVKVDVPLLELMDLNPVYVSRDVTEGEDECAAMFSVHYGDDYPAFEDFEVFDEEE